MNADGRLRRKRVARDGERITFAHISDHATYGFSPTFSDGSPDHTSPHRPGYRFADTNDAARLAAEQAYEERSQRLQDAWRKDQGNAADDHAAPRTLDQARALADAAWEDRKVRMRNAWRNR